MDSVISKFKSDIELTDLEKVELCRYVRNNCGDNLKDWAIKEFGIIRFIKFLKFYGIDKSFDEVASNKYYKHFTEKCENKETISITLQVVDAYYKNIRKQDIDYNSIVSSYRKYPNGLKEGITIKKYPYDAGYVINVFGISGDFVYDVSDNVAEGGKQMGVMFRFINLPLINDLIASIMIYDIIEKSENYITASTDFGNYKCYKSAFEFDYLTNI